MLNDTRLAFIGGGNMGEAMVKGLVEQRLVEPRKVTVSDPKPERRAHLAQTYGVRAVQDNVEAVSDADVVVLAIKPQVLKKAAQELHGKIPGHALVLSIIAGARIAALQRGLAHKAIARAMPNTPAQIGQGISVWTTTPEVSPEQVEQARTILGALGEEIWMDDENYLDMATALSGTGPGYVFLFMEAMIDAGVHLGFSRDVATRLVLQTMQGSVALARATGRHPTELRNAVTSPGGTTAEALYQLEKGGLRTVLSKAIWAAYQKSRYLGGLSEQ
ncbi:MAG: pyrroline-5-carboxylate reductase [Anaerolineae bacterium]